jgi:hypothetical protein
MEQTKQNTLHTVSARQYACGLIKSWISEKYVGRTSKLVTADILTTQIST